MEVFSQYLPNFLLILLRAGIVISLLPFLGSRTFPVQFRIGIAVAVALVLTPVIDFRFEKTEIVLLVMREVLFGIMLGFAARFMFFAVDIAGQVMSNAMGMSIANAFNPDVGQSTDIARLYGFIAMLVFLSMDAHHDMIYIFVKSYEWVPGGIADLRSLLGEVTSITARMFTIALKISAPMIVIMLITNMLFGFINKAAPQMSVFFVGYPVYIFVGFLVMLLGLPVFIMVMTGYFGTVKEGMARMLALARG